MPNQVDNATRIWDSVATILLALVIGAAGEAHFGFFRGDVITAGEVSRKEFDKLTEDVRAIENRQYDDEKNLRNLTSRIDAHLGRSGVPAGVPAGVPQRQ